MTAAPSASSAPPTPPGQLTVAPSATETRAFLEVLDRWIAGLHGSLLQLDADSQLAGDPTAFTSDISLAMSLYQSIVSRRDELVTAWDSGRVGADELAHVATLLWGRLPDPLGAPSAFTLTEAGTLAAALIDRLTAALSADAVAGSGVAGRITAVESAIGRCQALSDALGLVIPRIDELGTQLAAAIESKDRDRITTTVTAADDEVTTIERDLIKETSRRAGTAHLLAQLQRRFTVLEPREVALVALADRCRSRVSEPPHLAVPSVTVLGPPPEAPTTDASTPSNWAVARAELDHYAERIGRLETAFSEAEEQYGAPLRVRDDLRGLLGAYRTRAGRSGLAEDPSLTDAYRAAHDALWSAPCDLDAAEQLVERYQHAVRRAVGVDRAPRGATDAPLPTDDQSEREGT